VNWSLLDILGSVRTSWFSCKALRTASLDPLDVGFLSLVHPKVSEYYQFLSSYTSDIRFWKISLAPRYRISGMRKLSGTAHRIEKTGMPRYAAIFGM
jgi:hypothetical protein